MNEAGGVCGSMGSSYSRLTSSTTMMAVRPDLELAEAIAGHVPAAAEVVDTVGDLARSSRKKLSGTLNTAAISPSLGWYSTKSGMKAT